MAGFESAPQLETLEASQLSPAEFWDYWELTPFGYSSSVTPVRGGSRPLLDLSRDELAALDTITIAGFITECLPMMCSWHFRSLRNGRLDLWTTQEEAVAFLAPIDTPAEAMLLARAEGYWLSADDLRSGAVRPVEGGFELLAMRGRLCPRVDYRVLLFVDTAGAISSRGEEVVLRLPDTCVVL